MYATVNKSGQKVDPSEIVNTRSVSNAHTSVYSYYECQRINPTETTILCEYEENRAAPIIDKPSDYKFAIQRVEASLIDIPMFNSDDRTLEVTCTYPPDNLQATESVVIPTGLNIYNINQVLPYINTALEAAFLALQVLYNAIYGPGAWALNPLLSVEPFGIVYEESNDRLVIYSDVRNAFTLPTAMGLLFNADMEELFKGNTYDIFNTRRVFFSRGYGDSDVVTLPDGLVYLANVSSYSTSAMWYSIKQIVVISEKLTSRMVQIGTPGLSGVALARNIVLDFNYVPDNMSNAPGTRLQYLSTQNRWTDLTGDNPVHSIDFKLYYRNRNERLVPITLRPGESFSILCLFAKTLTN